MHKDADGIIAMLLTGVSRRSVVVRVGEAYLCKNVSDRLINVLIGHRLGILCYFDEILAKGLDTECQHVL